jgi:pre-mRNA-splicing factor ATP-dependent RNA helicase DHX15/PRP43
LAYKDSGDSKDFCYENFLNQLARQLRNHGIELKPQNFEAPDYYNNIRRCLSTGLFMQVAHLQRQGNYLTAKDHQVVAIHPSSVLNGKPLWVLFQEFVMTTRNYIRSVTPVPVEWLIEEAPHYFDLESWPDGETKSELVSAYRRYAQMKEYQDRKIKEKKEKKEKRG